MMGQYALRKFAECGLMLSVSSLQHGFFATSPPDTSSKK